MELDFVSPEQEEYEANALDADMTIGELMEWRYIRAEREKEQVSIDRSLLRQLCTYDGFYFTLIYREMSPLGMGDFMTLSRDTSLRSRLSQKCHIIILILLQPTSRSTSKHTLLRPN